MQQQVQTGLAPEQVLSEAASFFSKRRAKISDRTPEGLRFGLPGSDETGSVRITTAAGAGSTVTVEAEGLGLLAIAEGYVRELRKAAQAASRQPRSGGGNTALSDLRQRLGMPEPVARQRPRGPGQSGPATSVVRPGPMAQPSQTAGEGGAPPGPPPTPEPSLIPNAAAGSGAMSRRATEPDGPVPIEAATVSAETGPQGAPSGEAAIEAAHPSYSGPTTPVEGEAQAPVVNATSNAQPSAEALGGVPSAAEVQTDETPAQPNPGTPAGGAAGAEAPEQLGIEASEAPGATARQSAGKPDPQAS